MRYRRCARLDWEVAEIGYGMWGMGGWTGSDDTESARSLDRAVALGCNFFDTALAYGDSKSERLLGQMLARHQSLRLYIATKVPPLNRQWPGRATTPVDQVFPYNYVMESAHTQPVEHRRRGDRPAAAARVGRFVDRRWRMAARRRRFEARRCHPRLWHQRQPVGAAQRVARARHRPGRCGLSTTSSIRRRPMCCSPRASAAALPSSRACRLMKAVSPARSPEYALARR